MITKEQYALMKARGIVLLAQFTAVVMLSTAAAVGIGVGIGHISWAEIPTFLSSSTILMGIAGVFLSLEVF